MSEFDEVAAQIDALHLEAEDLADMARNTPNAARAAEYREDAKRRIRKAARLRAQMEGGSL